jgi:GNAT superfamily N-acetyltransferase
MPSPRWFWIWHRSRGAWMHDVPNQYLLHIRRLFRALETSSFEAGAAHGTGDGLGVALWLPPSIHSDETEHYRPTEPHWYLSLIGVEALHRNRGCGATLLQYGLRQCDREHRPAYLWSSNLLNTSLYQRHGFKIVDTIQVGSSPAIFPMLRRGR